MTADATGANLQHGAVRSAVGVLPVLEPITVADDLEVDALVRDARATLARLSLELRTAQHEAELAGTGDGHVSADGGIDLRDAKDLLRETLEARVAARRRELALEVERARADAVAVVDAARADAENLLAAAREEMLRVLLDGAPTTHGVPPLHLVTDAAVAPVTAPSAVDPFAVAQAAVVPDTAAATPGHTAVMTAPTAPPAHDERDLAEAVASEPTPAPAFAGVPSRVGDAVDAPAPSGRAAFWARYLYADVLLPLVAVLVVVVVLLAWVG